ncbi:hypothetical protein DRN74_02265 [Candidatus Micrarchaeota archaeon]|nr:MAG: hypothetical protein DRN74_02265 [Candidatus Micrarchaeota archaeon]
MFLAFVNTYYADTASMSLNVGNVAPSISNVQISNFSSLSAHEYNHLVVCTFDVYDANGYSDISTASANFSLSGRTAGADEDTHYTPSPACTKTQGGSNTANVRCRFLVDYYADYGTWYCYPYTSDSSGAHDDSPTQSATSPSLVTIEINGTYPGGGNNPGNDLDFGSIAAGQNSSVANFTKIINVGNRQVDVQISGTDLTGSGTIDSTNITFNKSVYGGPTKVGSKSADPDSSPRQLESSAWSWADFNLRDRADTDSNFYTGPTKTIAWKVRVPTGTATGSYSGTLTITGVAG